MASTGEGLIVDVGMHDGSDTAFYLAKGFDVLAVEANGALVDAAMDRFRLELEDGRLTLVHAAVAEERGLVDFHISTETGWSSLRPGRAGVAQGVHAETVTVEAMPLDEILAGHRTPHYVKIDIEGADAVAVKALPRLAEQPRFVSFEADLVDPGGVDELLLLLSGLGFRRFQMVNQALNARLRPPRPPREGDYAEARFTGESSGLFGDELPDVWVGVDEIRSQVARVARSQAVRAGYAETGRVFGVPLGKFHRPLRWIYNARPVATARARWAARTGGEVGGWFDIHAAR